MVNRCVAAGCNNTHKDGISLFRFPKNALLRKKWAEQVRRTRAKWEPTKYSVLCSAHFTEDCFELSSKLSVSLGLGKRKAGLKADAVPTLFIREVNKRQASSSLASETKPAKRRRTAYEKRERARVSRVATFNSAIGICAFYYVDFGRNIGCYT